MIFSSLVETGLKANVIPDMNSNDHGRGFTKGEAVPKILIVPTSLSSVTCNEPKDFLTVAPPTSHHASKLSHDEEQLLAKLEEQNRLLETDSKSLCSINGALQSPCSSKVFSIAEGPLSPWGCIIKNWEEWSKKKVKHLKEMIRKGVHPQYRATVWQLLCSAHSRPIEVQYTQLLEKTCPCEKLIQRDLDRIFTVHQLFHGQDASFKKRVFDILKAYSVLDQETGYNQGSAFIVGLLLMQMPEEDAFCVFVRLMQDFRLRELYRPHAVELGCCMYQLEGLIQEHLPELHSHFQTHALHTSMFSSPWFLTIFLSCLPLPAACRIFDVFMCEGLEVVFRVGLAILQMTHAELMNLDMESMMQFLEKMAPQQIARDPDEMIATAYQIKYSSKRMKKLEKEYTAIKMKEMEEEEEIKKLHAENKSLRKRIDLLEKRCSEDLVWQLGQELTHSRLREVECQYSLKQIQIKILLEKESSPVPDEGILQHLQEQLLSGRLREEEALNGFRELRQHIKDLEEKWQQKKGTTLTDLQEAVMSVRLREAHARVQLGQSRHKLLQLQIQNQIRGNQLKRVTELTYNQTEHLQSLATQNRSLRNMLRQTTKEAQHKNPEEEWRGLANDDTTVAELKDHISQLQIQGWDGQSELFTDTSPKSRTLRSQKLS
ncbi:ecotropic viral integration site 5 protein homolog isoform X3 [Electrophorus electricus]|uniref:ecotropic viral integration site 5 protein homolog isoform X3 n=1 Tax=Electrophorus electricus TaxID=8005 RepID=UPI0015CF82A1|nr:ecotropic viral integration site 5 protein homolog isoform X3 [Electrophorus electricus]XP_026886776.2 ecotropic viral integration site 5 protein homolog isoform X3 [Electrophorus electricus]